MALNVRWKSPLTQTADTKYLIFTLAIRSDLLNRHISDQNTVSTLRCALLNFISESNHVDQFFQHYKACTVIRGETMMAAYLLNWSPFFPNPNSLFS